MPRKVKDVTGQRFGRLTVVERVPPEMIWQPKGGKRALWNCRCDCGKSVIVRGTDLRTKRGTLSCGCLRGRPFKGETMVQAFMRRGYNMESTPADLTRFMDISELVLHSEDVLAAALSHLDEGLRERGYNWFRVSTSLEEQRVYLEAWFEYPVIEGLLNKDGAEEIKAKA